MVLSASLVLTAKHNTVCFLSICAGTALGGGKPISQEHLQKNHTLIIAQLNTDDILNKIML